MESVANDSVVEFKNSGARWVSYVAATVLLLAVLLVIDGAYVAYQTRSALRLTADYLAQARESLSSGNVEIARRQATAAAQAANSAENAARRPSFSLGSYLPVIRQDLRAVAAITLAAEESATAALAGASLAEEIGLSPDGLLPAVYEGGRVDVEAIESAAPFAVAAEDALARAEEVLGAPSAVNLGSIRQALSDARASVSDAHRSASRARLVFSVLPGLLGSDDRKRYMLAFQALGEARGTGGLIGLVGTLEAADGQLKLEEVSPVLEVFPQPLSKSVEAPSWFRGSYERQAALRQIQQANVSPNLPVVSEVLLKMVEEQGAASLDGLLMMDPLALQRFLGAMEPIRSDLLETELNGSNAAQVILHDSYLEFATEAEQNAFLADVVDQFWQRITEGSFDTPGLAAALGEASSTGHLKIYVNQPSLQRSLTSLNFTGGYPIEVSNAQMVFHNNYGVNKVDYFLNRSVGTEVRLTDDGNAEVTVKTMLHNDSPSGPPSLLIGSGETVPPGVNRMLLSFMLPVGAEQVYMTVNGRAVDPEAWVEEDRPVASTLLRVSPAESREVTVRYFIPGLFDPDAVTPSFELALVPQTLVAPDDFSLEVLPPAGFVVTLPTEGIREDRFIQQGKLDSIRTFPVTLSRLR